MVLTPKLELRQGQQLVMTPQLQQAIRLLQLSNIELTAFVEAELERNPLLEREEAAEAAPEGAAATDEADNSDADWEASEPTRRDEALASDAPAANGAPSGPDDDRLESDRTSWAALRPSTHSGEVVHGNVEEFVPSARSLADHLTEQLNVAITDPAQRLIGVHLIHMVDEAG